MRHRSGSQEKADSKEAPHDYNRDPSRQRRQRRSAARRPRRPGRHPGDRPVPMAFHGVLGQRHAQPLGRRDVLRLRRRATAPHDVQLRHRPPAAVRCTGQRRHAGGVRPGRPRRLPDRGRRRRGPAEVDPAPVGAGHPRRRDGPARHTRRRPGCPQRLQRRHRQLPDRRRRHRGRDQGAGRAVAEALRGLRHPDQPDQRHRRRLLIRSGRAGGTAVPNTTTVIVGAGHCGLAMSPCLAARSIDHVVLERGEVANSWRTQRWDSLRLLTPNWMTRLPGYAYRGADPDGYLSAREVTAMLEDYAGASAAPVLTGTTVTSVRAAARGYVVRTDQGSWRAPTVVLACGAATAPAVPTLARLVPDGITSLTPAGYRNPGELPGGGVLVVAPRPAASSLPTS